MDLTYPHCEGDNASITSNFALKATADNKLPHGVVVYRARQPPKLSQTYSRSRTTTRNQPPLFPAVLIFHAKSFAPTEKAVVV